MTEQQEKQAVANLLSQGYKVEVVNPHASAFPQKYYVYNDMGSIGKKLVIVNEYGEITGLQG